MPLTFRKLPGLTDKRTEHRFGQAPTHLEHSVRKPKGYIQITDSATGIIQDAETLMCSHCQFIWIVQPGSGRQRGFCLNCNGPTCGKRLCETRCLPFEKVIENTEKRR